MIGLVIVTHGKLAAEFVLAMEHVVGPQPQVAAISIFPDDDMVIRRRDIFEATQTTDSGQGVILLTDMFGGTPSNLAISVMDRPNTEVIAGINLPMLIKLATMRRSLSLEECASKAREAGQKYITIASQMLVKHDKSNKS